MAMKWCKKLKVEEEVPYCFFESSIKFQGHKGWKIDDLNPIWVRLLGRSQLSNPSDLPCSKFLRKKSTNLCKMNIIHWHISQIWQVDSSAWDVMIYLELSGANGDFISAYVTKLSKHYVVKFSYRTYHTDKTYRLKLLSNIKHTRAALFHRAHIVVLFSGVYSK